MSGKRGTEMNYEHDIKTLLTIGENIVIEFKRAGNGPEHDTYESICAFLNRQGGDVLLGVTDDGKVIGVPPKAAPSMVRQIVNVMNDPNLWEPRIAVYPGIITPSNLRPYSKNPIIANFFHQIGRADELGSGVRNLYHYVKLYSGADPIFDEKDIFRLTVPLNADYSPEKGLATTQQTTLKTTRKTTTRKTTTRKGTTRKGTTRKIVEERLRELIGRSPTLSLPELASELEMTTDGVYYHINALKKAGKLRRIGGRKSGHWECTSEEVSNKVSAAADG